MKPLVRALGVALVLLAAGFVLQQLLSTLVRAPGQGLEEVLAALRTVLPGEPQVVSSTRIVFHRTRETAELALVEGRTSVRHSWTNTWAGSEKSFTAEGDFMVKSGYVLDDRLALDVDDSARRVLVTLPPPSVLSVEQENLALMEENGWWNRLQPAEREAVLGELQKRARASAEADGETLQRVRDALQNKLGQAVPGWIVTLRDPASALPSPRP